MLRKGEEEGWPAEGAKRKKGRVKTGQCNDREMQGPYSKDKSETP